MRNPLPTLALALTACLATGSRESLVPLLADLDTHGRPPVDFVLERLDEVDLLLFDDGLHSAVEPFDFYAELVASPAFRRKVDVVFLEVVPLNHQPLLDAFLAGGDVEALLPAFRDDVSGVGGIGYRTYLDLLTAIRTANEASPPDERLRVVAVSNPVWWSGMTSPADVAAFRRSMVGRDFDMYRLILDELDGFHSGKKGVFLTNTRHAYTGVRRADGTFFWNTGTFFRQWHPGRTCSIRIHNVALAVEGPPDPGGRTTAQGLERVRYRWTRVDDGRWDRAFAARANAPVAVPLAGTAFGRAPYLGNHQLEAAPGQTWADAYDALVFLAPLEQLHQSAAIPGLYAADFRAELARRYRLLHDPDEVAEALTAAGCTSVEALVEREFTEWPRTPVPRPD